MRRRFQLGLGLIAALTGCYQFFHLVGTGFGTGFEMSSIAKNLAAHGTYANPFAPAITGATALVPPMYPLFLAVLIKISGSLAWMALIANAVNIFANAFIAASMPQLSGIFFGDWRPGIFAGALWIGAMRLMPQWDATTTIALLIIFCLWTAKTVWAGRGTGAAGPSAGILAGVLSLLNPATFMVFGPWLAYMLVKRRVGMRYAMRYAGLVVAILALCNVPWVVRNYRIWHAFVLRTSFGVTLYSSNNPCAESSLTKDASNRCFQSTHPVSSAAEVQLLNQLGEVQYDRNRASAAWSWIRSNPRRFATLTTQRIVEFWFPEPIVPAYTAYGIWAITLLSVPGIVIMIGRRQSVTIFIGAVWMLYPLMYYVVVSCDRYRYPILWTSMLPAGYCLAALLPRRNAVPSNEGVEEPRTLKVSGSVASSANI